jgi:hypothetical protein
MRSRFSSFLAGFVLVAVATCVQAQAQSEPAPSPSPSPWQWRVTPYVWLPTINSSFHFEAPDLNRPSGLPPPSIPTGANVNVGPNKYLSKLNSALAFSAEAHSGNGGVFADFMYLNISSQNATVASLTGPRGMVVLPINVSTSSHVSVTMAELALTGNPFSTRTSPVEGLVGLRYASIRAGADWSLSGPLGFLNPTGSANKTETQLMPVVGVKGRLGLGPHWFVPLYADYGANSALTSWQGILGLGYGYRTGAVLLGWRQLSYFEANQPTELVQNLHLGGPDLGWTFEF